MSRQEAIEHLGTIAKSGTSDFLAKLTGDQKKDAQLIGQFGVGFYSSFIVAEKVEVFSRRAGLEAGAGVHWTSAADGEFTVSDIELPERGTRIVLHLKEGDHEFADQYRIRSLVRKYSDHIAFPVRMPKPAPHKGEDEEKKDDSVVAEVKAEDAKPEFETVNAAQALWARPRTELKDEEYKEFYRHVTHDFTDPLAWSHGKVEGKKEYTSLLYIPSRAPYDLWHREGARGLKLYVRRVFIMDDAEQFLPLYLRFVKGVVDSADLPLNISREMLQQDPAIETMKTGLARRVLDMLTKMAKDEPEKYATFWKEFGTVMKEGPAEDHTNRERIAKLLRFSSTLADKPEADVSLEEYVGSHEGRSEGDLLRHRRQLRRREVEPASGSAAEEGHRSAAVVGSRRRMAGRSPARVRRQAAEERGARRAWISRRSRRTRKRRRRKNCRRATPSWSSA